MDIAGLHTHQRVYDAFKTHSSGERTSTRLHMYEMIRGRHPGMTVQCVTQYEYDFLGYANAGHAKAELHLRQEGDRRDLHDTQRKYVKPSRLVEDATGKLSNDIAFGRWVYTFNEQDFVFYQCEWELIRGNMERVWFILAPRHEIDGPNGTVYNPLIEDLLLAVGKWTSVTHNEIYVFDSGCWQKSAELWKSIEGASWDDVVLDPAMKSSLIEDVESFYDNHALYRKYSVPWKRGIILHGVPGNGKTASLRAIVNGLQKRDDPIPSLYIKSFEDKCNGSQASIHSIFKHARRMAPCLLIFEDLDSLVVDDVRSYFLNEVDGLESNEGILMIGSTNHLDRLDPAIAKRPSRFDRKYHFKVPSLSARSLYCQYWRKKLSVNDELDFPAELCDVIATFTEGFSFAYLKELFVASLLNIARGTNVLGEASETEWDVVSENSTPQEGSETVDADKETAQSEGATPSTATSVQKPKELPVAEIPDNLKDNIMLKMLHYQARVLMREMDNTEEAIAGQQGSLLSTVDTPFCSKCGQSKPKPVMRVQAARMARPVMNMQGEFVHVS